jgi:DNA-3-methyladenine glycosylase
VGKVPDGYSVLGVTFYRQPTREIAKKLLGKYLIRFLDGVSVIGKIVETEAYYSSGDPACHSYRGMTRRNKVMFGPSGRAYVYFTYGNHYLLNVVTNKVGRGEAVLLRALEPVEGHAIMRRLRGKERDIDLASGPGKLTQALAVDIRHNGCDLRRSELVVVRKRGGGTFTIGCSPRIGIREGRDLLERYYISGNRYVSVTPRD